MTSWAGDGEQHIHGDDLTRRQGVYLEHAHPGGDRAHKHLELGNPYVNWPPDLELGNPPPDPSDPELLREIEADLRGEGTGRPVTPIGQARSRRGPPEDLWHEDLNRLPDDPGARPIPAQLVGIAGNLVTLAWAWLRDRWRYPPGRAGG